MYFRGQICVFTILFPKESKKAKTFLQRKMKIIKWKWTIPFLFLNSVPSQIYENIVQTELTKFLMVAINRTLINLCKWSMQEIQITKSN